MGLALQHVCSRKWRCGWLLLVLLANGAAVHAQRTLSEPSSRTGSQQSRSNRSQRNTEVVKVISLPKAQTQGSLSFEQALMELDKVYQMQPTALDNNQISQLAWAAQMQTVASALAAAESRRATLSNDLRHNMQLYFVTGSGVYAYLPNGHQLEEVSATDRRMELVAMALNTPGGNAVGCGIVIAGPTRTSNSRETQLMKRLLTMETGRIAQNIRLQAMSLGLVTASFDTFNADGTRRLLELSRNMEPFYILFAGQRAGLANNLVQPMTSQISQMRAKRVALVVSPIGFSESELLAVSGILQNAGVDMLTASATAGQVTGDGGQVSRAMFSLDQVDVDQIDALVFIGGPGVASINASPLISQLVSQSLRKGKIVAATGTGSLVLASVGALKGVRVAADSDQQQVLQQAGAIIADSMVERQELIITSRTQGAKLLGRGITNALVRQ